MLQQFLRTASDGWDLALASVRDLFAEADLHADEVGGDFAGEAARLGLATAEVHDVLAEQFPTETWGAERPGRARRRDADPARGRAGDRPRARASTPTRCARRSRGVATSARPGSPPPPSGCTATSTSARRCAPSRAGRSSTSRASRPSRWPSGSVPTSPWRDVAGMLRSFDYAAHAVEADVQADERGGQRRSPSAPPSGPTATSAAFLAGYVENSGRTADGGSAEQDLILRAYVADKAVYEAVYEARNRPTWLPIPLAAIGRLASSTHRRPRRRTDA